MTMTHTSTRLPTADASAQPHESNTRDRAPFARLPRRRKSKAMPLETLSQLNPARLVIPKTVTLTSQRLPGQGAGRGAEPAEASLPIASVAFFVQE